MLMGMTLRCLAVVGLMPGLASMAPPPQPDEQMEVCTGVDGSYESFGPGIDAAREALRKLEEEHALEETLAAKRKELADLVFRQDCVRADMRADPVRGPGTDPRWVTLSTYYATNRRPGPTEGAVASYTGDRGPDAIRYGRVTVSIPTRRQPGDLNLPMNLWLFELPADPSRHFIIKAVTPLGPDAAVNEMKARVGQLGRKSVLIFVHGYNVRFREAALRTAQLAHDLSFPGLPIFFSWPSAGTTAGYPHDEEMSELSLAAFNKLLDRVASLNASEVFIVAHSMGNRLVTRAIAQRLAAGKAMPPNLKGLLLAAPDINAEIFREQIAPRLAGLSGTRKTIYASNNDAALRASSMLHDFARVGLTRPSVQTFAGWETVDATSAAPVRRGFGHSYVVDSPAVIRDMQVLIYRNWSPQARGLRATGTPPGAYWTIP